MNEQKIAVIVDNGCDLPEEYVKRDDVFVLPFRIIYKDAEYISDVDITAFEVLDRLDKEIPTTSLPTGQDILGTFEAAKEAGYTSALVVNISANLSGTNDLVNLMAKSFDDMAVYTVNTKNIGIGAGFFAIDALACIDRGMSFADICKRMDDQIKMCKVFFSVQTLEYLQKGGRIGLVSSLLGAALKIKPVISCNEEGIYYTVKKTRGRKQSLAQIVDLAEEYARDSKAYYLALCVAGRPIETEQMKQEVEERFKHHVGQILFVQADASLSIHTGPDLVGIGVYRLPEGE